MSAVNDVGDVDQKLYWLMEQAMQDSCCEQTSQEDSYLIPASESFRGLFFE